MASHLLRKTRRRPRPYTRSRTRRRNQRNAIIASVAVLTLFVVALLLWAGNDDGGSSPDLAAPSGGGGFSAGTGPSSTATPSPAGTLPALPGFGNGATGGPNSTRLISLGPGSHRVVITARSNAPMLAVAYAVRGDKQGKIFYNVKSPVTIVRTMTGGQPFAAVALQVSNNGTTGSCSITIDGKVADSRSINKSYAVMGCAA